MCKEIVALASGKRLKRAFLPGLWLVNLAGEYHHEQVMDVVVCRDITPIIVNHWTLSGFVLNAITNWGNLRTAYMILGIMSE